MKFITLVLYFTSKVKKMLKKEVEKYILNELYKEMIKNENEKFLIFNIELKDDIGIKDNIELKDDIGIKDNIELKYNFDIKDNVELKQYTKNIIITNENDDFIEKIKYTKINGIKDNSNNIIQIETNNKPENELFNCKNIFDFFNCKNGHFIFDDKKIITEIIGEYEKLYKKKQITYYYKKKNFQTKYLLKENKYQKESIINNGIKELLNFNKLNIENINIKTIKINNGIKELLKLKLNSLNYKTINCFAAILNLNKFNKYGLMKYFKENEYCDGVNLSWLYFGLPGSIFCCHKEDGSMQALNAQIYGIKVWFICIDRNKLNNIIKPLNNISNCNDYLLHKTIFIYHPGVFEICITKPGDILFVNSGVYHQGFSLTNSISKSINIFLDDEYWYNEYKKSSIKQYFNMKCNTIHWWINMNVLLYRKYKKIIKKKNNNNNNGIIDLTNNNNNGIIDNYSKILHNYLDNKDICHKENENDIYYENLYNKYSYKKNTWILFYEKKILYYGVITYKFINHEYDSDWRIMVLCIDLYFKPEKYNSIRNEIKKFEKNMVLKNVNVLYKCIWGINIIFCNINDGIKDLFRNKHIFICQKLLTDKVQPYINEYKKQNYFKIC